MASGWCACRSRLQSWRLRSARRCGCATSGARRRRRAASRTTVELRVRNTGDWTWSSAAVLPVQIGARIDPVAGEGLSVQPRFVLPRAIAPGETLETAVELVWPAVPGRYRASLDLVAEDLAWFADKVGRPWQLIWPTVSRLVDNSAVRAPSRAAASATVR